MWRLLPAQYDGTGQKSSKETHTEEEHANGTIHIWEQSTLVVEGL